MFPSIVQAIRSLRARPALVVTAVVILTIGIGGATVIFSVTHNAIRSPFPYAAADEIVVYQIRDRNSGATGIRSWFSAKELAVLTPALSSIRERILNAEETVVLKTPATSERLDGALISGNTSQFLGMDAAVGRGLSPADDALDAPPVFVMSDRLWRSRFGADRAIVGTPFNLNGRPATLVGIMPARFRLLAADVWLPIGGAINADDRVWRIEARLKDDVSPVAAQPEFAAAVDRLARQSPANYPRSFEARVERWSDSSSAGFRGASRVLTIAVALLLLIMSANIANILLAAGISRAQEFSVRSALGATRAQLTAQVIVEGLLLGLGGAIGGAILASAGVSFVQRQLPANLVPPEVDLSLNLPVLAFCAAVAVVTALLFSAPPAALAASARQPDGLKAGGRGAVGPRWGATFHGALIAAQVAIAVALLGAATLFGRTLIKIQSVDLGFTPSGVVSARLQLPAGRYDTAESKQMLMSSLLDRARRLPAVTSAASASALPGFGGIRTDIIAIGQDTPAAGGPPFSMAQLCSAECFDVLQNRLIAGRHFTPDEDRRGDPVAVVNESLTKRYFPSGQAVGQRIRVTAFAKLRDTKVGDGPFEIVGVIADAKNHGVKDAAYPEVIVPSSITGTYGRSILVRTTAPAAIATDLRREIWAVDNSIVVSQIGTLPAFLEQFAYVEPRFTSMIALLFACVGAALVASGIFGVVGHAVARRRREIGLRLSLGATPRSVQRMMTGWGLRWIGVGLLVGVAISLASARGVASQVWGVNARDPLSLGLATVLILAIGLIAAAVPARRAALIAPLSSLRD